MAPQATLEESYLALIKFMLQSKHRLFEIGARAGLSRMQVITVLLLENPRPMADYKHIFNCDASNVTGIIDGLEQKGFVSRYDVAGDRRAKCIKLTAKGRRLRSTLLRKFISGSEHLLAKLNESEVNTFIGMVQKITS